MKKIMIHSYKGGSGKTSVAVNMASALSRRGHKVLLIETDFKMPCLFGIYRDVNPRLFLNDFLQDKVEFKKTIYGTKRHDIIFCNPDFNPDDPSNSNDQRWFRRQLERLMTELEIRLLEKYDYVIWDTPPGWHLICVNNYILSDIAVIVTRPNYHAVEGTIKLIDLLYRRAKPKAEDVWVLWNQVPLVTKPDALNDLLEEWETNVQDSKTPIAGKINCSCEVSYEMAKGNYIFPEKHEFTHSLVKAMKKMQIFE